MAALPTKTAAVAVDASELRRWPNSGMDLVFVLAAVAVAVAAGVVPAAVTVTVAVAAVAEQGGVAAGTLPLLTAADPVSATVVGYGRGLAFFFFLGGTGRADGGAGCIGVLLRMNGEGGGSTTSSTLGGMPNTFLMADHTAITFAGFGETLKRSFFSYVV